MDIKAAQDALASRSGGEANEMMAPPKASPVVTITKYQQPIPARVEALATALGLGKEALDVVLLALVDDSMPDSMLSEAIEALLATKKEPEGDEKDD